MTYVPKSADLLYHISNQQHECIRELNVIYVTQEHPEESTWKAVEEYTSDLTLHFRGL